MKPALLIAAILFAVTTVFADMPKAGGAAPLFSGQDQDGKEFKLADLVGKKVVLTFLWGQPNNFH